ncbi:hypothetical protein ACH427_04360 [Streptomyces sp. NPDC020379]|uniref:hypothetical protein n=1 Tax=Streptomyces sp. NPDC020379 TaxID=3365071 RepID=UPI003796BEB7
MATPPDPTDDLKREIARLTAANAQLTRDKADLADSLKDAQLGLRPNRFYPVVPVDDPFLMPGYTIQQSRPGQPTAPTGLTVTYSVVGTNPQFAFSWKAPLAGAPGLYRIYIREGEVEGTQHSRWGELDGQLTSFTWVFKDCVVRSRTLLFEMVAVTPEGRRSSPLAVRADVR